MNDYKPKTYPDNGILPVIHIKTAEQTIQMAGMAKEVGASGVFLIDHEQERNYQHAFLAEVYKKTISAHPDFWIGVNCLAFEASSCLYVFGKVLEADGVWTDNATGWVNRNQALDEDGLQEIEESCRKVETSRNSRAVYFGGLAMKGVGYIHDPTLAAEFIARTQHYVDVVTTSGPGTSYATTPERLRAIRGVMREGGKLAVASGISADNISAQAPYVDYCLVASSIETEPMSGFLVRKKIEELVTRYHDANN